MQSLFWVRKLMHQKVQNVASMTCSQVSQLHTIATETNRVCLILLLRI